MDDWREKIRSAWLKCKEDTLGKLEYLSEENENVKAFYDAIWEASMSAFDVPREVQVVIDRDGKLLMEHAVVLGGDERMYWYKTKPDTKFVRYESKIDDMDALYTSATDVIDENQRMLTEWDGSFI